MKKLAIVICLAIVIGLSVVSIFYLSNSSKYNQNPDISGKIVGSKDLLMDTMPMTSVDDLTKYADLIVIGKVISPAVDTEIEFPFPNEDLKQSAMKGYSKVPTVALACSRIQIEETLYGESKSDIITLAQLGKANNNRGETKVKNGDRMLFILQKHHDKTDVYSSALAEDGLFIIDNNDKVTSLSDNMFTSRYDGISKDILKADIKKGKKKK